MPTQKEWTLMFYFASDNPLAPGIVTQLKAIKNAGYQKDTNVVAYFDPQPVGTPTHFFDVNSRNKLIHPDNSKIGFTANDPFVRNLLEDRLWRDELDRNGGKIRDSLKAQLEKKGINYTLPEAPPSPSGEAGEDENSSSGPAESLDSFLTFCAEEYPADHYMLFILGHGVVVGDDVFLFDEHAAKHAVTLLELGQVLNKFKTNIKTKSATAQFELVSFHSCSMSGVEVVFELQDTANYMLASQGPAFVGSWAYREILIRIFNDIEKKKLKTPKDVKDMIKKIFKFVYHNSTDYLLAGYSFDLCLCELKGSKLITLAERLKNLSEALIKGLNSQLVNYCILLAHWKSQSYWQENYTDLCDFCFCLNDYCEKFIQSVTDKGPFQDIQTACVEVMKVLEQADSDKSTNPIIQAQTAGPDFQYAHGLSVFFPWSRPTADKTIVKEDAEHKTEYEKYKYNQTRWFSFLNQYWGPQKMNKSVDGSTLRPPHKDEDDPLKPTLRAQPVAVDLFEDMVNLMFNSEGGVNKEGVLSDPNKVNPPDPTGDECACGSIKNYLRDTRTRRKRYNSVNPTFTIHTKHFDD